MSPDVHAKTLQAQERIHRQRLDEFRTKASPNTATEVSNTDRVLAALLAILNEHASTTPPWPPSRSTGEGFAMIAEAYGALRMRAFGPRYSEQPALMRKEAIQLGAMVLRFLSECC